MADEAAQRYRAGVGAYTAGDMRGAAAGFLTAFGLVPDDPAYRRAAFDILNLMSGYRALPAPVIAGLERAIAANDLDLQPLALVVRNLLEADPRLAALEILTDGDLEARLPDAGWLLEDQLLRAVLTRAVNISPRLEAVFARLRAHLCHAVADDRPSVLRARFRAFSVWLAAQCVIGRYVWAETAAEGACVARLAGRQDDDALLVRAAYRPLQEIDATAAQRLAPELLALWQEEADVRARAQALPQLTSLAPGLSAGMQAQYETYPYPRWRWIDAAAPMSLRAFLERAAPGAAFAGLDGAVDVLIAGCGTGRPALALAQTLPTANITAVDLSRTSLAYAQHMAAKLGVANITFAIADILALAGWSQRFHFIECSGVLHHMSDPAAGLRSLRGLLRDDGAMLVSLYSERGRVAEAAAQAFVQARAFPDTADGLRSARSEIMALPPAHPAHQVTATPDFFTRDGLHDLIFNLHESRLTPAAMKRLLHACGLKAIAVEAPTALGGAAFRARYPDPFAQADLDLWDAFEQENPQVFAQMIQVWCRPA